MSPRPDNDPEQVEWMRQHLESRGLPAKPPTTYDKLLLSQYYGSIGEISDERLDLVDRMLQGATEFGIMHKQGVPPDPETLCLSVRYWDLVGMVKRIRRQKALELLEEANGIIRDSLKEYEGMAFCGGPAAERLRRLEAWLRKLEEDQSNAVS